MGNKGMKRKFPIIERKKWRWKEKDDSMEKLYKILSHCLRKNEESLNSFDTKNRIIIIYQK